MGVPFTSIECVKHGWLIMVICGGGRYTSTIITVQLLYVYLYFRIVRFTYDFL